MDRHRLPFAALIALLLGAFLSGAPAQAAADLDADALGRPKNAPAARLAICTLSRRATGSYADTFASP